MSHVSISVTPEIAVDLVIESHYQRISVVANLVRAVWSFLSTFSIEESLIITCEKQNYVMNMTIKEYIDCIFCSGYRRFSGPQPQMFQKFMLF